MYQEQFMCGVICGLFLAALLLQFKQLRRDVNSLLTANQVKAEQKATK